MAKSARRRTPFLGKRRVPITLMMVLAFLALLPPSSLGTTSSLIQPNGKLAFGRDPYHSQRGIYVANADGSGLVNLTAESDLDDADAAAWSPDGSKIAFIGFYQYSCCDVYVMNADGSGLTNLSNTGTTGGCTPCGSPFSWSPDGREVAFIQANSGGSGTDIYVSNVDGTTDRRLTYQEHVQGLAWGPGGKIAFEAGTPPIGVGIFVLDPTSGRITRLTPQDSGSDFQPAWSPSGTKIAFLRATDSGIFADLYIMNWDGSNQARLTEEALIPPFWAVSWSPDGSQIAYTFDPDPYQYGDMDVYVVNADGSGQLNVTNQEGDDWAPAWSPDGLWIAFADQQARSP
jgi:Tol biopolymer transport system component